MRKCGRKPVLIDNRGNPSPPTSGLHPCGYQSKCIEYTVRVALLPADAKDAREPAPPARRTVEGDLPRPARRPGGDRK